MPPLKADDWLLKLELLGSGPDPAARKSGIEAALLAALIDDPPMKDGIEEEEEVVV